MGSCVIASTCTTLRWQNRIATAKHWRETFGNGQSVESLREKYEKTEVRYAETTTGDVAFLEWALRTRRGANVVWMNGRHMLTLVYFDGKQAAILDNNATDKIEWMPRERFLAEWRASGGWATVPVYTPMAPAPIY
jgi:ABC-type bacteriocin/lantibiotic exporter with double-glycine peptidase domain